MSMNAALQYITQLEGNNSREWFHDHDAQYRAAKGEFEAMVGALMDELRAFDGGTPTVPPKELTFKLQRDTRFSRDKAPYNPSFRAHIGGGGKLPVPVGYYLMIKPGDRSFLGGGLFADMFRDATAMVRNSIAAHKDEWEKLIKAPAFRAHFEVNGSSLKNVPKEFAPDHPQAAYLKMKSWYLEYPVPDDTVLGDDFVSFAARTFEKMKPFNDFLNRALKGFEMPTR